jgi:hypothetical protein
MLRSDLSWEQAAEWARCYADVGYFVHRYCWVFNANEEQWMQFSLWPTQRDVLYQMDDHRLVIVLKARQLGLTWLALGFCLWLMLFRPASVIGIFSRIETDAKELLDFRLKGMYERLPVWMRAERIAEDNKSRWRLSNGSTAMAFATTGGRSYTFSLVLVDEADFQPDLDALMRASKPAIDGGGRMILLSTSDKSLPESRFKNTYRAAKAKLNEWHGVFLPWHARPGRTREWYDAQARDTKANTGSLDDLYQEYPETDTQALSPRSLDKRIPGEWLEQCYVEAAPLRSGIPSIPGLTVYAYPQPGTTYVIGVDTAEGNPTSDPSAATVLEFESGEEVASLTGRFEIDTFAAYVDELAKYFRWAAVLPERNNHGHAFILWFRQNSRIKILEGHDGGKRGIAEKPGWLSNSLGKALMYSGVAESLRDRNIILHTFESYMQLSSIEGATLRAPGGAHDDLADSVALADRARVQLVSTVKTTGAA